MVSKVKENRNKNISCIIYFLSDPKTCVLRYLTTEQFTLHFLVTEGEVLAANWLDRTDRCQRHRRLLTWIVISFYLMWTYFVNRRETESTFFIWKNSSFFFFREVKYIRASNRLWWSLREAFRRRQWHPTPVLLPGKSYGRRSLVGCSPWGR